MPRNIFLWQPFETLAHPNHDPNLRVNAGFAAAVAHARLRRGTRPPPPLATRAHWGFRPHRRPLRICCARLHFADRFRAGAGRRPGSGRRQGVRFMVKFAGAWGWSFLSRPLVDRGVRGGLRWLGRPRARRAVLRLFNAFVCGSGWL